MTDRKFNGNNPYYSPERCGLEIVVSIETDEDYEFDIVAVWRDSGLRELPAPAEVEEKK